MEPQAAEDMGVVRSVYYDQDEIQTPPRHRRFPDEDAM